MMSGIDNLINLAIAIVVVPFEAGKSETDRSVYGHDQGFLQHGLSVVVNGPCGLTQAILGFHIAGNCRSFGRRSA